MLYIHTWLFLFHVFIPSIDFLSFVIVFCYHVLFMKKKFRLFLSGPERQKKYIKKIAKAVFYLLTLTYAVLYLLTLNGNKN